MGEELREQTISDSCVTRTHLRVATVHESWKPIQPTGSSGLESVLSRQLSGSESLPGSLAGLCPFQAVFRLVSVLLGLYTSLLLI